MLPRPHRPREGGVITFVLIGPNHRISTTEKTYPHEKTPQQEDKKTNKTAFIKVRCTAEEKERIRSRAANAGRKYSDYCREMLLGGSVVAIPPMGDNEREALAILRQTALFYAHISNLIKVKDPSWVDATKALATYAKIAFKRFFSPRYQVPEEVFKRLNIEDHDRKV